MPLKPAEKCRAIVANRFGRFSLGNDWGQSFYNLGNDWDNRSTIWETIGDNRSTMTQQLLTHPIKKPSA